MVRHPFERLVSAFRDRIEDNSKYTTQAWVYVPRIFYITRPQLTKMQMFDNKNHHRLLIIPTFEEFITWLLTVPPTKYDVHWNRYFDHCGPCNINYNSIVKMDHFTQHDEQVLMEDMGLGQLNISLQHFQQTLGGSTNFTVTCQYFKHLSKIQVHKLYQIYKEDFLIFQYEPDPYINCAQSSSTHIENNLANVKNLI